MRVFQGFSGLTVDGKVGPHDLGRTARRQTAAADARRGLPRGGGEQSADGVEPGPGQFLADADPPLATDGVFGPLTARAVSGTQAMAHVSVDGVVGLQTWALSVHANSGTLASLTGVTAPQP